MPNSYDDYDPIVRTRTLARAAGPYLVAMALTLIVRQGTLDLLLPAFMQDGPLLLTTGAFTLAVGLAVIAAHHHFSSAAATVITIIGIAAALKGACLMVAPELGSHLSAAVVHNPPLLLILSILLFIVGLWLTYVGWFAAPPVGTKS